VLEVIHTTPLLNKLEVYAGMGVHEVWVFNNGVFAIHELELATARYTARPSSTLLPNLDFALVARHAMREDTPKALREFEAEIRKT